MDESPPKDANSNENNGPKATDPSVPIDFSTFILSLSSSAAFHLGLAPHPENEETNRNLPMAKQTIDLLAMLEEKTQGNLTSDEANILKNILYELRILYIKEKG